MLRLQTPSQKRHGDSSIILRNCVGYKNQAKKEMRIPALSSNIVLTTQASVYTSTSIEYKTTGVPDATASSFFTDGRVGVAYLF